MIDIKTFKITVWSSSETEIEAETQEEAEEIAIDNSRFSYADYCETEELENRE